MNAVLWVLQALLAAAFLGAGAMKLTRTREALVANGMGWAEGFSPTAIKLIGLAEVLGAIGVILPALTKIAPILVPIAASCLALTMVGAVLVHIQRKDPPGRVIPSMVLAVLAVIVAFGRFGAYAF